MELPNWLIVLFVLAGLFFLLRIALKLDTIADLLRLRNPPE
jgi:hypothetical protein